MQFPAHGGPLQDLMLPDDHEAAILQEQYLSAPRINLNARQLCDLELLCNGGFSPLTGFLDAADYRSVLETMRLRDGTLWPIPVVLDVADGSAFQVGQVAVLCDPYGTPHAYLTISSIYQPNVQEEAQLVYGSTDRSHPGVQALHTQVGAWYLGGRVQGIQRITRHDFRQFRQTPHELRSWFAANGWERVIGFQTRNPLHRVHVAMIERAAVRHQAKVLLHPTVGVTKAGDIDYITRVRCYQQLVGKYLSGRAKLSLLPLAMRMAGPREALWHAIIRKNYGCTHFIIGRDHAGPGADAAGRPFYEPYAAQALVQRHAEALGIAVVAFPEMVYVEEARQYLTADEVQPHHTVRSISGTALRQKLKNHEDIPEWFSYPEVIAELRRGAARERKDGLTIFFTGLSAAGKSTIATLLYHRLLEAQDKKVTLLDGDVVRQNLSKGLGFSRADRNTNITRIGFVAREITKHGGIAICSAIAPYAESRDVNRQAIQQQGAYVEVYVSTPISVCRMRDRKGLYRQAEQGILKGMTGVDDPYEVPEHPELILDTTAKTAEACANEVFSHLEQHHYIVPFPQNGEFA